jgi:hypothetical protein
MPKKTVEKLSVRELVGRLLDLHKTNGYSKFCLVSEVVRRMMLSDRHRITRGSRGLIAACLKILAQTGDGAIKDIARKKCKKLEIAF